MFGKVPLDIEKRLRRVSSQRKLERLLKQAVRCSSLKEYREVLASK
jgi:hypothetical protein